MLLLHIFFKIILGSPTLHHLSETLALEFEAESLKF